MNYFSKTDKSSKIYFLTNDMQIVGLHLWKVLYNILLVSSNLHTTKYSLCTHGSNKEYRDGRT